MPETMKREAAVWKPPADVFMNKSLLALFPIFLGTFLLPRFQFQKGLMKNTNGREPRGTGQERSRTITLNSALCNLCCANGNVKGSSERGALNRCLYYCLL